MSAKNINHDAVIHALESDGWRITHDPLTLSYGGKDLFVDLGAARNTIAAEKAGQHIAVEIQSFISQSSVHDLENAVGQYSVYESILIETGSDRQLYLAVPSHAYEGIFTERFGQMITRRLQMRMIVFDPDSERILKWIL